MKHDLIHIQGKPYALVPLHEYRMMSTAGQPQEDTELPEDLMDTLFAGEEHPVRILRTYRGLTQDELANTAKISRPYLTEIETGRKNGSIKAMASLAKALDVPVGYLVASAA